MESTENRIEECGEIEIGGRLYKVILAPKTKNNPPEESNKHVTAEEFNKHVDFSKYTDWSWSSEKINVPFHTLLINDRNEDKD